MSALYPLLPRTSYAANLGYEAIGLAAAIMVLLGVRRNRPGRRALWHWLAAGKRAEH